MKGWLIINSFMNSDKFIHLYEMLCRAFEKHGVSLEKKTAKDISLEVGYELNNKPDFAIFWDKDIYLAERLESAGIRLFNSKEAVELCDNKILMYQKLQKSFVRIPRTFIAPKTFEGLGYNQRDFIVDAIKELGFPLIVKEAYGSFGEQVYLAKDLASLNKIINQIGYKDFLMQEYIEESKGKDLRMNVVGEQVVVTMLRENDNDFRSNISNGGRGSLFEPEKAYIDLAIKASKALGLDFAGVDILFGKDGPIVCEVNSNPQFASTLKSTGVNLAEYIADYIINCL